jgi:hypothetical protein
MRRLWLGVFVLLPITAFIACGGSQPEASNAAGSSDVCPLVDPGPPPVCPEGCTWNGEECRKHSGVLIIDSRPDGGGADSGEAPPQ